MRDGSRHVHDLTRENDVVRGRSQRPSLQSLACGRGTPLKVCGLGVASGVLVAVLGICQYRSEVSTSEYYPQLTVHKRKSTEW